MFRFLKWSRSASPTRRIRSSPARSLRLEVEPLEGRLVPATISAVSWNSAGAAHHAVYAIGIDDDVSVSVDGGGFISLGGYVKQISAGLDGDGNPEVYGIGIDDALYVNKGNGWVDLGGYVKGLSATARDTVYVIGSDNSVFMNVGGKGYVSLGGYALDISAGLDNQGDAEVYAIGSDHALFVNSGGGFVRLGGYVKAISATVHNTVYAIGRDDSASIHNSKFVRLGGYVKEISAGLDADGKPELFAIGKSNSLLVNKGKGFVDLGGYVRDIAAPTVGVGEPGDVAYGIGSDHDGFLNQSGSFTDLGGYIQVTTQPGGTTGAASWADDIGPHQAFYVIGSDDAVYVSVDGGEFSRLGGYAKQISVGLDADGLPEVYGIGINDALDVYKAGSIVDLGGYVKEISATADNTVYAIAADDSVFIHNSKFVRLGSYALQISAGLDSAGKPEVYAIASNNALLVNKGSRFVNLGGYVKQISATVKDTVYAIGKDDSALVSVNGGALAGLGGYVKEISAGLDADGDPELFAIGMDNSLFVNNGGGFVGLGGYVRDIAALTEGVGVPGDVVYAIGSDHSGFLNQGDVFTSLGGYIQG
jgi:hypothetical protein